MGKSILALLLTLSASASAANLEDLAFLSGCWQGPVDGASVTECWGTGEGGLLLGTSKTVAGEQAVSFEFLRIARKGSQIAYTPFLNGKETVSFPLMESTPVTAVFSNLQHDFPKTIHYRRAAETLVVTLSGEMEPGQTIEISYELRRFP